jgi:Fungal protein kinase
LWQYPQRKEEGKLLYKVIKKKVVNMARYYHYKIVYIGGKEDDICNNIRKGLDITRATNYKLEDLMMYPRPAGVKIRKG